MHISIFWLSDQLYNNCPIIKYEKSVYKLSSYEKLWNSNNEKKKHIQGILSAPSDFNSLSVLFF